MRPPFQPPQPPQPHPSHIYYRSSFQTGWQILRRIKRHVSRFKEEMKRQTWNRSGFKSLYKRTNSNPPQPNTYSWKIHWKSIFFYRLHSLFLKYWVRYSSMPRDRGGDGRKMAVRASLFLCASKYFWTQSDPAIPWPGKDPDEPGVDGWIYHVLSVCVVVKVPLEDLRKQHQRALLFLQLYD